MVSNNVVTTYKNVLHFLYIVILSEALQKYTSEKKFIFRTEVEIKKDGSYLNIGVANVSFTFLNVFISKLSYNLNSFTKAMVFIFCILFLYIIYS